MNKICFPFLMASLLIRSNQPEKVLIFKDNSFKYKIISVESFDHKKLNDDEQKKIKINMLCSPRPEKSRKRINIDL